jgi:molecular chaperone GrpE
MIDVNSHAVILGIILQTQDSLIHNLLLFMSDENTHNSEEIIDDIEFEETEEGEGEATHKDKLKKLRDEIKSLKQEKQEYLDGWQRSRAEYANLQKETDTARVNNARFTKQRIFEELLPVLDSFTMAMSNTEVWESVDENWRKGIEYIRTQLLSVMESHGVTRIDEVGIPFDPLRHEPIETEPTDDESLDNTIKSIIQTGFAMGDDILRPAKVIVYKK